MVDGERFGPYRIEALLGRGGMGEVYRAYDESHKRMVALKLLSPYLAADESYRARFRRESELAARLREAHVIPIHRYGEVAGRLFLDMRLVDGMDLAAVLRTQVRLPAERAVHIIGQVARALDAAHADGLIHRDVKPSNVLVSHREENGDDDFVYLVDFGIARSAEEDGQRLTVTGEALGSFDYMAPERFLETAIDRRADVYSLTCLLYECLTGRRPFPGNGLPAQMFNHLNSPPPQPSRIVPGLSLAMDEVIARGMAKLSADRYSRAGELAVAARAALRAPPIPSTPAQFSGSSMSSGPGPRTPRLTRTRAALFIALVAALVSAATIGALALANPDRVDNLATNTVPGTGAARTTSETISLAPTIPPDPQADLLALIPVDFPATQCEPDPGVHTPAAAAAILICGPSMSKPGPSSSTFSLYTDFRVQEHFLADMAGLGILPSGADLLTCSGNDGFFIYYAGSPDPTGYVVCRRTEDGSVVIQWTQAATGLYGQVTAPADETSMDALWQWWMDQAAPPR